MTKFIILCILITITKTYGDHLPRHLYKKKEDVSSDTTKGQNYVKSNFISFSKEVDETRREYLRRIIKDSARNLEDLNDFNNTVAAKIQAIKKNKSASKDCQALSEKLEKRIQNLSDQALDCADNEFDESDQYTDEVDNVYTEALKRIQKLKDKLHTCEKLYKKTPESEAATRNCFDQVAEVVVRIRAYIAIQFSAKAAKMTRLHDEDMDFDECNQSMGLDEFLDQQDHFSALLDKCTK